MAFRHDHRFGIVLRQVGQIEHGVGAAARQRFAIGRQVAFGGAIGRDHPILRVDHGGAVAVGRHLHHRIGQLQLGHGHAVQPQLAILHLHRVTGQADHPLDPVILGDGRFQHHDIAAFGQAAEQPAIHLGKHVQRGRQIGIAIGIFRHDQPIANQQAGQHRSGRDVEGLGHRRVDSEHGQRQQEQLPGFLRPIDLLLGRHSFAHSTLTVISTMACAHGWSSVIVR